MIDTKFRAWSPGRHAWMCGYRPQINIDRFNHNATRFFHDESDMVYEQYTGLKDRDGKEIYEGDIIQWWNKVTPSQAVVRIPGGWNPFIDDMTLDSTHHIEVIGNIHENPELLECQP